MRFKKLLKQYPKLFSIIIVVFGLSLLIGAYIASYCLILPLAEKTIYKYYVYDFYIPVEYLRLKSNIICRLTEWGYEKCGGRNCVFSRRNDNRKYFQRLLDIDNRGILVREWIGNNEVRTTKFYNYKGDLFAKWRKDLQKNEIDGMFYSYIYNLIIIMENGNIVKKIYRTKQGIIVAECIYRNNKPWKGSVIDKRFDAKITYREGKQIKIESFNLNTLTPKEEGRGKGWPEIKDFSFPFKYGPEIYVDPKFYYEDAGRYK